MFIWAVFMILSVSGHQLPSVQAKTAHIPSFRVLDDVTADQVIQYLQDNGYEVFSVEQVPLTGEWKCSTGKDGTTHTTMVLTAGDTIVGHFDIDV